MQREAVDQAAFDFEIALDNSHLDALLALVLIAIPSVALPDLPSKSMCTIKAFMPTTSHVPILCSPRSDLLR